SFSTCTRYLESRFYGTFLPRARSKRESSVSRRGQDLFELTGKLVIPPGKSLSWTRRRVRMGRRNRAPEDDPRGRIHWFPLLRPLFDEEKFMFGVRSASVLTVCACVACVTFPALSQDKKGKGKIDPNGEPAGFHKGLSARFALWHGKSNWHFRVTTAGKTRHFRGV